MGRVFCIALNPAIDVSSEAQHIHATHKIRTRDEKHHPGGGGVNVARVVAELGLEPELFYVSGGAPGVLFDQYIDAYAIRSHRIRAVESTRVSYTVHEKQTGFEYRFVPEGPLLSASELQDALDFIENWGIGEGDYVVASGSLPRGASDTTYHQIASIVEEKRAFFILDSSGPGLQSALDGKNTYLVKPSLGELEKLVGAKLDQNGAKEAAMELVGQGCAQYVAVSMGAHGAFLASESGIESVPAIHVKLQSAVGAGDSFVGAVVYSLAQGNTMSEGFRLGVSAGAAAVMTKGTELCRRDSVFALFDALDNPRN